jgi:hypothetical protein
MSAEGDVEAELQELMGDDLAKRVAENFSDYAALAARDSKNIEKVSRELNQKRVIRVPYLDEDVHDLAGLLQIDRYLFATAEEREKLAASA